jgi:hypothetical protein
MQLYLRSRLAGWAVVILAVIGVLSWIGLRQAMETGSGVSFSLILMPLLPAVVIGASTRSPFGDTELSVGRSLPLLRFAHLAGLLACGALALGLAASGWSLESIKWELVRNMAGYSGLAFVGARVLGSGICWVVPLGYGVVTLMVDSDSRWAWLSRLPADRWSMTVATTLIVAGLLMVTLQRTRDTGDDVP